MISFMLIRVYVIVWGEYLIFAGDDCNIIRCFRSTSGLDY